MNPSNKPFYKSKKFISMFGTILGILSSQTFMAKNSTEAVAISLILAALEALYLYVQGSLDEQSINQVVDTALPVAEQLTQSEPELNKIIQASKPIIENVADTLAQTPAPAPIQNTAPVSIPVENISTPATPVEIPVSVTPAPTPDNFIENIPASQPDPNVQPVETGTPNV